jgi:hypothetical protein
LGLIKAKLDAVKAEVANTTALANESQRPEEFADQLRSLATTQAQYQSALDNAVLGNSKLYQDQKKVVEELAAAGKPTEEASKKLDDIAEAAINAAGAVSQLKDADTVGATFNTAFTAAKSSMEAFADTAGDTKETTASDFKSLMQAMQEASKLGIVTAEEYGNVLKNVAVSELLTVEQRIQAMDKLRALRQDELKLKQQELELQKVEISISSARGDITSQEAAAAENKIAIAKANAEIESKTNSMLEQRSILVTGAVAEAQKSIEVASGQRAAIEANLETELKTGTITKETYNTKMASVAATEAGIIATNSQIMAQAGLVSEAEKKEAADIAILAANRDLMAIKQTELELSIAISEQERKRKDIADELKAAATERQATIKINFAIGASDEFDKAIALANEKAASAREKIQALELESYDLAKNIGEFKEVSDAKRIELLGRQRDLQNELTAATSDAIEAEAEAAEAQFDELVKRDKLYASIAESQLKSAQDVYNAEVKVKEAIADTLEYKQQLAGLGKELAQSLNGIKIQSVDFDISLMQQALTLKQQIEAAPPEQDLSYEQERLAILEQALGFEVESAEQIATAIERKTALEVENISITSGLKAQQAEVDRLTQEQTLNNMTTQLFYEGEMLGIKNKQLAAELAILQAKADSGQMLSAQEQSSLATMQNQLTANNATIESLGKINEGIATQRDINEGIYQNKLKIIKAEEDHATRVANTNGLLAAQEARGGGRGGSSGGNSSSSGDSGYVDPTPDRAKYRYNGKLYSTMSEVDRAREAHNEKYDIGFKSRSGGSFTVGGPQDLAAQRAFEKVFGKQIQGSSIAVSGMSPGQTNLKMAEYSRQLTIEDQYIASQKKAEKEQDSDKQGSMSTKPLTVVMKSSFNSEDLKFDLGKLISDQDLENASRTRAASNTEDILSKQLALAKEIDNLRVQNTLIAMQPYSYKRDDAERTTKANLAAIEIKSKELEGMLKFARISNELQRSSLNLAQLGSQRQTKAVVSQISGIAEDLIDFYSADNGNAEILKLGEELEKLRNDPNATSQQILDVANKIKAATEETAVNTEKDNKYSSVLDAIKQGGFFGGDYRDSNAKVNKMADGSLTVSGYGDFDLSKAGGITQVVDKSNEKIRDIVIQGDNKLAELLSQTRATDAAQAAADAKALANQLSVRYGKGNSSAGSIGGYKPAASGSIGYMGGAKPVGSYPTAVQQALAAKASQKVTINNYPNQTGSVSSQLRASGF